MTDDLLRSTEFSILQRVYNVPIGLIVPLELRPVNGQSWLGYRTRSIVVDFTNGLEYSGASKIDRGDLKRIAPR